MRLAEDETAEEAETAAVSEDEGIVPQDERVGPGDQRFLPQGEGLVQQAANQVLRQTVSLGQPETVCRSLCEFGCNVRHSYTLDESLSSRESSHTIIIITSLPVSYTHLTLPTKVNV